jgi:hypothetical protein
MRDVPQRARAQPDSGIGVAVQDGAVTPDRADKCRETSGGRHARGVAVVESHLLAKVRAGRKAAFAYPRPAC